MSVNLILCAILVGLTTVIGVKFSEKFKLRRDIYYELLNYCTLVNTNIGFKKDTVDKLMDKLPHTLKRCFGAELNKISRSQMVDLRSKNLKTDELNDISGFFNTLGSIDAKGQSELLNYYAEVFKSRYLSAETVYQKYAKIYVKLGALAGVLIFIILV